MTSSKSKKVKNYKCKKHKCNDVFYIDGEEVCQICYYSEPYNSPPGKILQDCYSSDYYIRIVDTGRNRGTFVEAFKDKKRVYNSGNGDLASSLRVLEDLRTRIEAGENPFPDVHSTSRLRRYIGTTERPRTSRGTVRSVFRATTDAPVLEEMPRDRTVIVDVRHTGSEGSSRAIFSKIVNSSIQDCIFRNCILHNCTLDHVTLEDSIAVQCTILRSRVRNDCLLDRCPTADITSFD